MLTLKELHEKCLYPEVRVTAKQIPPKKGTVGSGTIIYSALVPEATSEEYESYVLTNQHVIDGLITVRDEWNSMFGRDMKKDFRSTATVETFLYDTRSRLIGSTSYLADIVCYDKPEDIALLKIRAPIQFPHVAQLCHKDKWDTLLAGMEVRTVGAGLGQKPFMSPPGFIGQFGYEFDDKEYLLVSAPNIFGNSGGADFLWEDGSLLGMPARIAVNWGDPITHMSFITPIWRICAFLEDQIYDFILTWVDKTSAQCEEERQRKRELEELKMFRAGLSRGEEKAQSTIPIPPG